MYGLQSILEIDNNFILESATPFQVMAGKKATPIPMPINPRMVAGSSLAKIIFGSKPAERQTAEVFITTRFDGYKEIWENKLNRFFECKKNNF